MLRLLQLIVLIGLVWLIARSVRELLARTAGPSPQAKARDGTSTRTLAKDFVPCALCGLHVPKSEALTDKGKFYCSAEHRDAETR
jgi:uncharacterized protein